MSNNDTVPIELYKEKAYKNFSFLPNVNPRWAQLFELLSFVFLDHIGALENVRGSNLKKMSLSYDEIVLIFDRTYAIFGLSELIRSDFISKL
jgi:hypothetical protein